MIRSFRAVEPFIEVGSGFRMSRLWAPISLILALLLCQRSYEGPKPTFHKPETEHIVCWGLCRGQAVSARLWMVTTRRSQTLNPYSPKPPNPKPLNPKPL